MVVVHACHSIKDNRKISIFSLSLSGTIHSVALNSTLAASQDRTGFDYLVDRSYSRPSLAYDAHEVIKTIRAPGRAQYDECSVNLTFDASAFSNQTVSRACQRGQWVYDVSGREATTVTDVRNMGPIL